MIAIDDQPATLSRRILTDLLRGELGYEGLVISDALDRANSFLESILAGVRSGHVGHLGGLHHRHFVHGRAWAGLPDYDSCYPYTGVWPYCQYY